ncbi:chromosome condensation regulator RCC1, partial [Candidatus Magnetomorum sp. HK-1]
TNGQLGRGDTNPSNAPIMVTSPSGVGFLTQVVAIAAGKDHCLALKNDGTLWAWGSGMSGRLGNDVDGGNETRPIQVYDTNGVDPLKNVIKIAAGLSHSLVLKSDGSVWAFGEYMNGRLGDNHTTNKTTPVPVRNSSNNGYLRNVIDIACSGAHSLALQSDGTLLSWGKNNYGQAGNNTITDQWTPVAVTNMDETQDRSHIMVNQNTTSRLIQMYMTHTVVGAVSLTVTSSNPDLIP